MAALSAAFYILFVISSVSPFLFPDLKLRPDRRSPGAAAAGPGRRGELLQRLTAASATSTSSVPYRIAVIQQSPYLFPNGTGYIPELLRHIAESFRQQNGGQEFQYDVVPVSSWSRLLNEAQNERTLSFGMTIPSLELTAWTGRQFQYSLPAVYTTLKLVVSKQKLASIDWSSIHQTEAVVLVVLRSSPSEYLSTRANVYSGHVRRVNTPDEALQLVTSGSHDVVYLTDATVADYVANKYPGELDSICPSHMAGSGWMHFSFFGRDSTVLNKLNEAISPLLADDTLAGLYSGHFSSQATAQCPW
jgi:hypothetical protein